MKFISAFSPKRKAHTCSGSPEYTVCTVRFSPDGNIYLENGAKRNRQDEINSYKASCDINMMIRRYENGDHMALLRDNTGAYVDLSTLPKNIHEAEKLRKNIDTVYAGLGSDIKSKYRDVNEFISAFSTKSNFDEFCSFAADVVKQRKVKYSPKEVKSDAQ